VDKYFEMTNLILTFVVLMFSVSPNFLRYSLTDYGFMPKALNINNRSCAGLFNVMVENLEGEIWLHVVGWEKLYEISNFGRVRSFKREVLIHHGLKMFRNPKIRSIHIDKYGYNRVTLRGVKQIKSMKSIRIHRLVAMAFIPNTENKRCVNHKDGNKKNNIVSNLEWCTHGENIRHAFDTGLIKKHIGVLPPQTKKVINMTTGKVYACARFAFIDYNGTISLSHFSSMLSGRKKNHTTFRYYNEKA